MKFTPFVDLELRGGSDEEKKTGVYNFFVFVVDGMILLDDIQGELLKSEAEIEY